MRRKTGREEWTCTARWDSSLWTFYTRANEVCTPLSPPSFLRGLSPILLDTVKEWRASSLGSNADHSYSDAEEWRLRLPGKQGTSMYLRSWTWCNTFPTPAAQSSSERLLVTLKQKAQCGVTWFSSPLPCRSKASRRCACRTLCLLPVSPKDKPCSHNLH